MGERVVESRRRHAEALQMGGEQAVGRHHVRRPVRQVQPAPGIPARRARRWCPRSGWCCARRMAAGTSPWVASPPIRHE